jgi:LmbE family N-acetylglucosaminyl deacetylase
MSFNVPILALLVSVLAWTTPGEAQETPSRPKVILAVGAHAGDMEVAAGAVLAKQVKNGDRVVFLHLTLGEGGNPKLSPEAYGAQKKSEAEAAARAIGAEVRFGPYRDGELPDNEEARRYVSDVIRQVKPTHLIAHWRNSLHRDHSAASAVAIDAVLLASLAGVRSSYPPHRGLRVVWFTENWEDREGFTPFVYVDVSDSIGDWEKCVTQYEFIRGGISSYPYLEYYRALAKVRGAEGGFTQAEAFDIQPWGKKQVYRSMP